MKPWKLPSAEYVVPQSLVADVMLGIGSAQLAKCILKAMQPTLALSHCTVFALGATGQVSAVSSASSYGEAASLTAIEYTRLGFDKQDSNMVWLAKRKTPQRSQTWLSHQCAEDVADEQYRRICYGENGIRERVSLLLVQANGHRIAVNFYRSLTGLGFTQADFDTVATVAQVLSAAVSRHVKLLAPETPRANLQERQLSILARRERQVIAHALDGLTAKKTAQFMQLGLSTVLTYRYRAFAKLGVRSQRELVSALLA